MQITDKVSNIIPKDDSSPKSREISLPPDMVPKPPEMPPPPSLLEQLEKDTISEAPPKPKAPLPKISIPKPPVPKVGVPKIEVPKVSIPKPPKISLPKPKPAPPMKAQEPPPPTETEPIKEKEDGFVFSEVTLGKFIQKDKAVKESVESPKSDGKKEEAEAKRKQALKRKEAELAAAVQKKKKAEEKKAAEEQRAAAAEKQRQLAEERKAAAEAKRREEEEKRQAAIAAKKTLSSSTGGTISLGAGPEKKAAEKAISKAKPGATVSLGFFNFGGNAEDDSSGSPTTRSSAPRGVPTISKWRQNRDGSISGIISGSTAFANGDAVTTSPITAKNPSEGTVVTSISGSK